MRKSNDKLADRLTSLKLAADRPDPSVARSRRDLRGIIRRQCFKIGHIAGGRTLDRPCVVKDLSAGGARIAVEGELALPERVTLIIEQNGISQDCRVCWQSGREAGLAF